MYANCHSPDKNSPYGICRGSTFEVEANGPLVYLYCTKCGAILGCGPHLEKLAREIAKVLPR